VQATRGYLIKKAAKIMSVEEALKKTPKLSNLVKA
jgi:hypothetical protein